VSSSRLAVFTLLLNQLMERSSCLSLTHPLCVLVLACTHQAAEELGVKKLVAQTDNEIVLLAVRAPTHSMDCVYFLHPRVLYPAQ
jgi:hypothetical protein